MSESDYIVVSRSVAIEMVACGEAKPEDIRVLSMFNAELREMTKYEVATARRRSVQMREDYISTRPVVPVQSCPKCGKRLEFVEPVVLLLSYPPKKAVRCKKCNYKGSVPA